MWEVIADAEVFRAWLLRQTMLHFHCRILGKENQRSTWVLVRSRTAMCQDETRCVLVRLTV